MDLSSYAPIYVRTTGDDSTADGTLSLPFATGTAAYNYALTLGGDNYVLDFGDGSFDSIYLGAMYAVNWPGNIAIRGAGASSSLLAGITWDNTQNQCYNNSYGIVVSSDLSISLGDISLNGAIGSVNNSYTYAWNVSLTDCVYSTIYVSGGVGGPNSGSPGGSGGSVSLVGCTGGDIIGNGGDGGPGTIPGGGAGSGGNGSCVSLLNSTVGNISSNGGNGGYDGADFFGGGYGGSGGNFYPTTSTYGTFSNSNGSNNLNQPYGGYNGTHYTSGVADSYNGWDYDYGYGGNYLYNNGGWVGDGPCGYNGILYYDGQDTVNNVNNGVYFDYGTGDYRYFDYGYWLTGGVSSGHFTNGLPDSYTGPDSDAESNNTLWILFINGSYITYGPFIWSDGYYGYDYLGPVADYSANLDGSVQRLVVNQSIVWGFYSQVWYGPSDFIGAAWDYNDGRYYFRNPDGSFSNPNNGESPYNSYQIMDLPHPSDVRAGVSYGASRGYGTLDVANVPVWDNYANYSQGDVVLAGGSLWYLSSTGGWTVGGAPAAGYGWQRLSTETQSSGNNTGIDFARLIGLPPFINL